MRSRGSWSLWFLIVCLSACCARPPAPNPMDQIGANRAKEDIAPEAATGFRELSLVKSSQAMVGAANPHASRAGLKMLREGGSAIDATIAMAIVLTLVEPQSSGIGGGAFLMHFDGDTQTVQAYDGRETAPTAATADMFIGEDGKPRAFYDAVVGGLSVGVPGELRMLELAHQEHGKLAWAKLFEPAIELAERGFPISPRLHQLLSKDEHLPKMPAARSYFYTAEGRAKPVGTTLVNRELAQVFREVARQGADAFYQGPIAEAVVKTVREAGANPGRLSLADLRDYRAKKREAVCAPYRQWRVCGMPPPTSGGVTVLQILGILENFDLSSLAPDSADAVHLFAEASRLAYADRAAYLADPDFVTVPTQRLLDRRYLKQRAARIQLGKSMGLAAPGQLDGSGESAAALDTSLELPSTSHMVVVDSEGNAVSMTASIENVFGSRLMVRGFLLNNELTDFSFVAEKDGRKLANRIAAGKRPRSSMAPTLVFDGDGKRFLLALGSPGGSRIIEYVARVLVAILDGGLNVQTAIGQANVVNRNGKTELESGARWAAWAAKIEAALRARGHQVNVRDLNSGLQAIMRSGEGYVGGADPRREGLILGY